MKLDLSRVFPDPEQPRKRFEQDALDELAQSIKELGLLQPIIVKVTHNRAFDGDGDAYLIVAGERRYRASLLADFSTIDATVIDVADDEGFVRSIAENVNREDMTVIEEADAYRKLIDQGWTIERIADLIGKRPQDIRWRLELEGLDPAVKAVVATGQIPVDLAWFMAQISGSRQIEVLNKWANGEFPNQAAAHAYCEAVKLQDEQEFFFQVEEIPEVTVQQQRARDKVRDNLGFIGAAMSRLEELLEGEDLEVAVRLGSDTARLREELDMLHKLVGKQKRRATKIEQMHNAGAGQSTLLP